MDTTAIAEFPLHIRRHAIVVGPRGSTLKRISAENTVRIFVPDTRHGKGGGDAVAGTGEGTEPDKNNIQVAAVFGGGSCFFVGFVYSKPFVARVVL